MTHLGPLTRTVADAALFLTATAGRDDRDGWSITSPSIDYVAQLSQPIRGLRAAWSPTLGYAVVDPEVQRLTEAAVQRLPELGWEIEQQDPGFADPGQIADAFRHLGCCGTRGASRHLAARMDPSLIALVENGQRLSAVDVAKALFQRQELWALMHQFFQRYDLLITPTWHPTVALVHRRHRSGGRPVSRRGWSAFTYPFNLTGTPRSRCRAAGRLRACRWGCNWSDVGLRMIWCCALRGIRSLSRGLTNAGLRGSLRRIVPIVPRERSKRRKAVLKQRIDSRLL